MMPTNKLRFVRREIGTPFAIDGSMLIGDTVRIEYKHILQQWWAVYRNDQETPEGAWIDIPVEGDMEE